LAATTALAGGVRTARRMRSDHHFRQQTTQNHNLPFVYRQYHEYGDIVKKK
jgi:hypothetical protein